MSNELQVVAQGDALTVYAVIRRLSDAYAWNGSAFEAWANANVATYDIPLASAGGDLYVGNFPSGIAAGTGVRVNYYQQAGGAPAITDLLLASRDFSWTGTALSSGGGSVGASGCQLTDKDTVKRFMELTDSTKDDLIQQVINQQSARIHKIIGRSLCAADYTEFYSVDEGSALTLGQWPVIHVTRVAWGWEPAIRLGYSGSVIRALAAVTDTGVRLTTVTSGGVTATTTLEFGTYPTISMMATAIDGLAGWTATALLDGLSSNLRRLGGAVVVHNATARTAHLEFPTGDYDGYEVRHETGLLRFRSVPWGGWDEDDHRRGSSRSVLVEYRAGYETIPQDVKQVATELVASVMARAGDKSASSTQNVGQVTSESIGDYSYSIAKTEAASESDDRLTGEQMGMLAPYMAVRVGGAF